MPEQGVVAETGDGCMARGADQAGAAEEDGVKIQDLVVIRTIGTGKFSRVLLCRHEDTGRFHAMKIMGLGDILRRDQVR